LPWFIWRWICLKFGKDIKAKSNWTQAGTLCSELVAQYITSSGYPWLFADFGIGSVSAEDVRKVVESNPDLFELIEEKE
jgi:hypothetical protein